MPGVGLSLLAFCELVDSPPRSRRLLALQIDGLDHIHWYAVQELFREECQGDALAFEERMRREGYRVSDTAVRWLTLEQYEEMLELVQTLENELDTVAVEASGWYMVDCLRRARKSNLI